VTLFGAMLSTGAARPVQRADRFQKMFLTGGAIMIAAWPSRCS